MIMTFAGGLYAVADDVNHLINTHCKVGRLTIPSAVADRLSIFAVAKRFVQPQRVGSLIFCCLVITCRVASLILIRSLVVCATDESPHMLWECHGNLMVCAHAAAGSTVSMRQRAMAVQSPR